MQTNYLPFICGAGLIISIIPLSIVMFWLTKKGWMSLRLLAVLVTVGIAAVGIVFWFFTQDNQILWLMVGLGVLAGLSVLSMRITNPSLMKLLKIKW
jgi:hypothetical protein